MNIIARDSLPVDPSRKDDIIVELSRLPRFERMPLGTLLMLRKHAPSAGTATPAGPDYFAQCAFELSDLHKAFSID